MVFGVLHFVMNFIPHVGPIIATVLPLPGRVGVERYSFLARDVGDITPRYDAFYDWKRRRTEIDGRTLGFAPDYGSFVFDILGYVVGYSRNGFGGTYYGELEDLV